MQDPGLTQIVQFEALLVDSELNLMEQSPALDLSSVIDHCLHIAMLRTFTDEPEQCPQRIASPLASHSRPIAL